MLIHSRLLHPLFRISLKFLNYSCILNPVKVYLPAYLNFCPLDCKGSVGSNIEIALEKKICFVAWRKVEFIAFSPAHIKSVHNVVSVKSRGSHSYGADELICQK